MTATVRTSTYPDLKPEHQKPRIGIFDCCFLFFILLLLYILFCLRLRDRRMNDGRGQEH
jgi:hypothetical protein